MEILFITGKGGVGKSAVAASLAFKKAKEGKRTLLVELGDQSFFKDYFELGTVSYSPTKLAENLDVSLWSGVDCLKEYAMHLIKIPSLYRLFFENSVSRALIQVAPGLSELSILGKITSGIRNVGPALRYDCLVIDSFASGHFLSLIRAPFGMVEAIRLGPMSDQSRKIIEVLKDHSICQYFVVSLPEELPVVEGLDLASKIEAQLSRKSVFVLNKVLSVSSEVLTETVIDTEELKDFQSSMQIKIKKQNELIQKIHAAHQSMIEVPWIFDLSPWQIINGISDSLIRRTL